MISKFGEYIRKIRKEDSLRGMAKKLEISAAFLSAMEVGKKKIPLEYVEKIAKIYDLTNKQKDELKESIIETNNSVLLDFDKMSFDKKQISIAFARKIENADPLLVEKLKAVLLDDKD